MSRAPSPSAHHRSLWHSSSGPKNPRYDATVRTATLGVSLFLTAVAAAVYLLGLPILGLAILGMIAVAMLFVMTSRDSVTVLTIFAVLLLLIPSRFVFSGLGALGTPARLIGMGALVWWLASRADRRLGANHGQQPMRQVLLVYGWWMVLTYGTAFLRPLSDVEASSAHRTVLSVVSLVGLALFAADGITDRQRLETLLRRVVALTGITAIIGILQFFGRDLATHMRFPGLVANSQLISVADRSDLARVSGTAIHAIEFGVVLAIVLPFALHFALHGDARHRKSAWLWAGVILFALPTAVSRSAVIGLLVALLVLAFRWNWTQRVWLSLLLIVMMAVTRAVAPGLLGTIRALFVWWGDDPSIEGRTEDYGPIYNYVSDSPWVGRGLGTFEPTEYFFVDNEWLLQAVNSGVVGVASFALLFVVAIACARGIRRRTTDAATAHLAQAFLATLVTIAVTYGTFDGLSFPMSAGLLFLSLGLLGAFWRQEVGATVKGRSGSGRLEPVPTQDRM